MFGNPMKNSVLLASLPLSPGLTACEKPTVVNVPPPAAPVAGPAGPAGPQGASGAQGGTTVIVVAPPVSGAWN